MGRDLFKKIRHTKGTFHANIGTIKDRNGMDLTEAEDTKKRWQEYTELYKKDLHDPDNHDGVITDLEPDILECEVKWALENITTSSHLAPGQCPRTAWVSWPPGPGLQEAAGLCPRRFKKKKKKKTSLRTKLVEVMEFQFSCSKSWKMMLWKSCTQYASKFGKLSSGHRTGKGQFSFQSQRKAMPKKAQTTTQLYSSHMLVK